ncbi:MAG: response regulator [Bacillales bacterium]|jgi:putative two-component system response regulator|nr:response regulator [Bacillales bacterium]
MPKKTILICDDSLLILAAAKLSLNQNYNVLQANSPSNLFHLLETVTPDLLLLDVEMPEMNGYEVLKKLKSSLKTKNIPVIFLTGRSDETSEIAGLSLGAVDYITKPFSQPILLKRIETHILLSEQKKQLQDFNDNLELKVIQKTAEIQALQNGLLDTITTLVEYRDDDTGGHISRTQGYVEILVDYLKEKDLYPKEIKSWHLEYMFKATRLHDVGKIAISDVILNKPGRLNEEEFEIMKTHAELGYKMLKKVEEQSGSNDFIYHGQFFALYHHEKWDGNGYPQKLKGLDIPLQGRLMAVADVYDALRSSRPYKEKFSHEQAKEILLKGQGNHFDPVLIEGFLAKEKEFIQVSLIEDI